MSDFNVVRSRVRIAIAGNALDCSALPYLLERDGLISVVSVESDLRRSSLACSDERPDVQLVTSSFDRDATLVAATMSLDAGHIGTFAYLDDDLTIAFAWDLLSIDRTVYLTRQQSIEAIARQLTSEAPPHQSASLRLHPAAVHRQLDLAKHDEYGVLSLSARERQVVELVASGLDTELIAKQLDLALSTVENHKSRAMKKLNVHRAVDLVRIAMRTGMIA